MKINTIMMSAVVLGAASIGSATVYETRYPGYVGGGVGINNAGGEIKKVIAQYDNVNETLYWEARFGAVPGAPHLTTNGFTLAINNGPNPKGTADELALLYFDASAQGPAISVYAYNGRNDFSSYKDGNGDGHPGDAQKIISSKNDGSFVQQFFNSVDHEGNRVLGFKISTAAINAFSPAFGNPANWEGMAFDQKFGVWFHPQAGLNSSYGQDGYLTNWGSQRGGWFDGADINSQVVPEPAALAALLAGLGLVAVRSRRK